MPHFSRSVEIRAPIERVFEFHLQPKNLVLIAPPQSRTRLVSAPDRPLAEGDRVTIASVQAGIPVTIEAVVRKCDPPHLLEDEQVRGPFARWKHRHVFAATTHGVRLTDEIEYTLPAGPLGGLLMGRTVERELQHNFEYRQEQTRRLLEGAD